MASKLMVNSAFNARLLVRPSRQRNIPLGTICKLGCPIPGPPIWPPILSTRSYSESPPTPPLPKSSRSTEGSQSSGAKDKDRFSREYWRNTWDKVRTMTIGLGLTTVGIGLLTSATEEIWKEWYKQRHQASLRRDRESARESAIYDKLKKGPVFVEQIKHVIPRKSLVEELRKLITPEEEGRLYPLLIGEHGTGKTSLIRLAMDSMNENEPKGVVYVDIPTQCDSESDVISAVQKALDWNPDEVIDSGEAVSLGKVLQTFSHLAIKYKREYKKVPVLIIDNVNRLSQKQQRVLDIFQDYAKLTADTGIVTVVFVSSEGRIPRHMNERSSWSRSGQVIEIGDVSKDEALQYLKLRNIKKQSAEIYDLVGGRVIQLKFTADEIARMGSLEAVRQKLFNDAYIQLKSAEILPGRRYHKDGAVIIYELLKKGSISEDNYYSLVDADTGDKLLETNVFAIHVNSRMVTFQSVVMKRYCEENSVSWGKK